MILSSNSIEQAILRGEIAIDPFQRENLKGASYTFTLGATILIPKVEGIVTTTIRAPSERFEMDEKGFILQPNQFVLGITREKLTLNGKYACILSVRGSCAQIGLNALLSSAFAEPDTDASQILEIHNASQSPIRLEIGIKIVKGIFVPVG